MKLRNPNFGRNKISTIFLFLEMPLPASSSQLKEIQSKARKLKGIRIRSGKDGIRLESALTAKNRSKIEAIEFSLDLAKSAGLDSITGIFQIMFLYEGKDYVSDPALPIDFPDDSYEKDTVSLTGVRLTFNDTASSLRSSVIDLRHCIKCNQLHNIANLITFEEEIAINGNFLLTVVRIAKKYSETFLKKKDKENGAC